MDLLEKLARAFDADYPHCLNQNHWKTVNHSHVHISKGGNINGGAGGKFNGNKWTSQKHPHVSVGYETEEPDEIAQNPGPQEPAVTKADLIKAWDKVNAANSAMNKVKKQSVKEKYAKQMLEAIAVYKELQGKADPAVAKTHKPQMAKAEAKANGVLTPAQDPLEALGKATEPQEAVAKEPEQFDAEKVAEGLKTDFDDLSAALLYVANHGADKDTLEAIEHKLDKINDKSDQLVDKYGDDKIDALNEAFTQKGWNDLYDKAYLMVNKKPAAKDPVEALANATEPQAKEPQAEETHEAEPDLAKEMETLLNNMSPTQKDLALECGAALDKLDTAVYWANYYGKPSEADITNVNDAAFDFEKNLSSLGDGAKQYLADFVKLGDLEGLAGKASAITGVQMSSKAKAILGGNQPQAAPPPAPTPKVEETTPTEDPLSGLANAANPPLPFEDYQKKYNHLQKMIAMVNDPKTSPGTKKKAMAKIAEHSKDLTGANYDNYSFEQKKQLWKAAGGKAQYLQDVKYAAAVADPKNIKKTDMAPEDSQNLNDLWATKYSLDDAVKNLANAKTDNDKAIAANTVDQLLNDLKGLNNGMSPIAKLYMDNNSNFSDTNEKIAKAQQAIDLYNAEIDAKIATDPVYALAHATQGAGTKEHPFPILTPAQKKNVKSFKSKSAADAAVRSVAGKAWKSATNSQKNAIYDYTGSYSKFNEPLRGIEYGTNQYKGVGKIDFDQIGTSYGGFAKGEVKKKIQDMTSLIDKSSYNFDMEFVRGCDYKGMDKYLGIDMYTLMHGSDADLQKALIGKEPIDHGFMSCGTAAGAGFPGHVKLHITAPAGTKMMYVEPISKFGNGAGIGWDGESKQSSFGGEFETIMQRGTRCKITAVKRQGGEVHIEMQVISQEPQKV